MKQFLFFSSLFAAEFCWKIYTTLFIALQIHFSNLKGPKFAQQNYLFCINTLWKGVGEEGRKRGKKEERKGEGNKRKEKRFLGKKSSK